MEDREDLETEALNLMRGKHPNVIKLLGVSLDGEPCVVLEYAQKGSLEDYLKK